MDKSHPRADVLDRLLIALLSLDALPDGDAIESFLKRAMADVSGTESIDEGLNDSNERLDELAKLLGERTAKMRACEEKFRSLLQKVHTAVVIHDQQGRITGGNLLAQQLLGLSADQLFGNCPIEPNWQLLREDGAAATVAEYPAAQVLASRLACRGFVGGIKRPGRDEIVWVLINAEPEFDSAGEVAQVIVSFVDITKQRRAQDPLYQSNRHLQLLRSCNQAVIYADDEARLLTEICRIAVEEGGYRMASIVSVEHDGAKTLRPVAYAGVDSGYIAAAKLSWSAENPHGNGPAGIAVRSGQPWISRNILDDPAIAPWRGDALRCGYRSLVALPLIHQNKVFAVLGIYAGERDAFDTEEVGILTEMTGNISFGISALRDRAERMRAERERLAHMRFVECLDQVNRAIQAATDLQQMLSGVLDVVLATFDCDRAFLLHPCDPTASEWCVPMERTRPEYPGAQASGRPVAMDPEAAEAMRLILEAKRPVTFGPGNQYPLPAKIAERFGFKSYMAIALHPRADESWQFGIHQCARTRIWTADEEKLLTETGRRLTDGLSSFLTYRNLLNSETRLQSLLHTIPDLVWLTDLEGTYLACNSQFERFVGASEADIVGRTDHDFIDRQLADTFSQADRATIATDKPRKDETWLTFSADGYRGLFETIKTPMRDHAGKLIGVLGISRDVTAIRAAERRARDAYAELQELASRRETAREEERKRIAREIHDELGQILTALRMGISTLQLQFGAANPQLAERAQGLTGIADKAIQVVREVATALRPAILDSGFASALLWLARHSGVPCQLAPSTAPDPHEDQAVALFRVAQESLTNVARHARATRVDISWGHRDELLFIRIADDGQGFDPAVVNAGSLGLRGMRERMLLLGGTLDIRSTPGKGTCIEALVPVGDAPAAHPDNDCQPPAGARAPAGAASPGAPQIIRQGLP